MLCFSPTNISMSLQPSTKHLCNITLLGNIVAKPEIRYLANPVMPITEFVIATHKTWFDKKSNQNKQWTHFHTVKMIGKAVEDSLIHANKGDLILVKGHLVDSQKASRQIIHATYACAYKKGFAPSMNRLQISGILANDVTTVVTETGATLAEFVITSHFDTYSPVSQKQRDISLSRKVHLWGKQATYLAENGKMGDEVVIDGNLSYFNNTNKEQLVDAQQLVILNKY